MPNLQNLLKRRPVAEQLDPEVDARLRDRLASLHAPFESDHKHEIDASDVADATVMVSVAPTVDAATPPILIPAAANREPEVEEPVEAPIEEPEGPADRLDVDDWDALPAPESEAVTAPDEPPVPLIRVLPTPEVEVPVPARTERDEAAERPQPSRARRSTGHATTTPAMKKPRAIRPAVACPYCAEPLSSPPVASGKCPRCRLRIVVKRVDDRNIYLTEAALPVFMAERRRAVHAGRWTRDRDRWLDLAKASGAEPESVARLLRQVISEEVIASSRNLYMSTVERAARAARRERRWEEAARLRFDQALALYRNVRSPRPLPAAVLAVQRDGLASSLRGIAEIAKYAELRARACCETCRADDGRTVRISQELHAPSLPHAACQKGLCHCRWYLAARDRAIVSDLLKRQTRARPQRSAQGS